MKWKRDNWNFKTKPGEVQTTNLEMEIAYVFNFQFKI